MKDLRQVVLGILAAILSAGLLVGSLSISLLEGNMRQALAPSATIYLSPTLLPPGFTPSATYTPPPGQLTSTPTMTLTPTITATQGCNYPSDWVMIYTKPGDTLESLAEKYHTTVAALITNNCHPVDFLLPGIPFYVPYLESTATATPCGPFPGWVIYIIRPGDTLFSLSIYFHVSVDALMLANCLTSDKIYAGDRLYVPNIPTPTYYVPPSRTPTRTPTPTSTSTVTYTPWPTLILTETSTPTSTDTVTATPSDTPTETPTGTPDATPTATSTLVPYPAGFSFWLEDYILSMP